MTEPYRNEADPLADRLRQLREELERIGDVDARKRMLEAEVREIERKVAEAETLEGVRIASPCTASWDAMKGDDRKRHCESCDKDVYDVAGMTRAEAMQLLRTGGSEGVCIRMFKRADGTVITSDCPVGVEKKRVRRLVMAGAGALATAAGGLWGWGEVMHSQTLGGVRPRHVDPVTSTQPEVSSHPPLMGTATAIVTGSAYLPPPPPPRTTKVDVAPPTSKAAPVRSGSR